MQQTKKIINDSTVSVTKDTAKLIVNKYENLKKQNALYRQSDSILLAANIKKDIAILDLQKALHIDSSDLKKANLKYEISQSDVLYYKKQVSAGKVKNTIVEAGLVLVIGFLIYKL